MLALERCRYSISVSGIDESKGGAAWNDDGMAMGQVVQVKQR